MADQFPIPPKPRRQSAKTTEDRFWEKVSPEPNSGCWLWIGGISVAGYGRFYFDGHVRPAHRAAYEMFVRPIPTGLVIDHLCRVPACVNPAHLEPVTHTENVNRGLAPQTSGANSRAKTHCPSGHAYTDSNIFRRKDKSRECRECARLRRKRDGAKISAQRQNRSPEEKERLKVYWREYDRARRHRVRCKKMETGQL